MTFKFTYSEFISTWAFETWQGSASNACDRAEDPLKALEARLGLEHLLAKGFPTGPYSGPFVSLYIYVEWVKSKSTKTELGPRSRIQE